MAHGIKNILAPISLTIFLHLEAHLANPILEPSENNLLTILVLVSQAGPAASLAHYGFSRCAGLGLWRTGNLTEKAEQF